MSSLKGKKIAGFERSLVLPSESLYPLICFNYIIKKCFLRFESYRFTTSKLVFVMIDDVEEAVLERVCEESCLIVIRVFYVMFVIEDEDPLSAPVDIPTMLRVVGLKLTALIR